MFALGTLCTLMFLHNGFSYFNEVRLLSPLDAFDMHLASLVKISQAFPANAVEDLSHMMYFHIIVARRHTACFDRTRLQKTNTPLSTSWGQNVLFHPRMFIFGVAHTS